METPGCPDPAVPALVGRHGHSTPCGPQVNVTLLDINDNHPTWKDAPYYINLVEMTPPDSDVTTVSRDTAAARQPCYGGEFPP